VGSPGKLPLVASVGTAASGGELEQSIRALGVRLIPAEPKVDPVVIPEPPKLPALLSHPSRAPGRVEFLAAGYRAVLFRRYGLRSKYMIKSQLDSHAHYERLDKLGLELYHEGIAPLAWVIFGFDLWACSDRGRSGKSPPAAKWIWSKKRWRDEDQRTRFHEARYCETELRAAPEARALYADWRMMWIELMVRAPSTREEVAAIVEKWFPGKEYERRLSRARVQTWELQTKVDQEMAAGGWPLL
jgi:hypothetical protein